MTETELLAKVNSEGWVVLQTREVDTKPSLILKDILCHKPIEGVMKQDRFFYFVKSDGTAYWKDADPFAPAVASFREKVQSKIASLIAAGTIKAGYVERMDEPNEVALVVAIKDDSTFATYHVYQSGGALMVTPVTGAYPM